jgi:cysteinyl-tRNA synthetase
MKPTAAQLEKVKEIQGIAQDWLKNYQTHKLSDDPEMVAALPVVQDAFKKTKAITAKFSDASALEEEKKTSTASLNPLQMWNELKEKWNNSQLLEAVMGGFTLENAPNIVKEANDFISLAETGAAIVGKIPGLGSATKTVQEWLKKARTALDKAKKGVALFNNFKSLSSTYDKIKGLFNDGKKVDGKLIQEAKGFMASAKQFINALKAIPGASDKTTAALEWVSSLEGLLNAAANLVGGALSDEDKNGLPDWYDKLKVTIDQFVGQTSLVPGTNVDDKVLAKAREIQAEIEKYLKVATKAGKAFKGLVDTLTDSLAKIKKFAADATKFVDAVKNGDWKAVYDQVKTAWRDLDKLTGFLPGTDVDDKLIAKAQALKANIEGWLTKYTGMGGDLLDKIDELKKMYERVTGFIDEGKTFAAAVKKGDWSTVFDTLMSAYRNFDKLTGFVPGTDIDDKIIAQAQALKAKFEDWLTKTTGMGGDLVDKIAEAKKIVGQVQSYITEGKKLFDAVKNGDWKTVYDSIKSAYNNLDKLTGFIPGTNADDKIIAQAQALKAQMEAFIKNKLGGESGNLFEMIDEIKALYTKVGRFVDNVKKFVDNVKKGDWNAVFEQIKSAYLSLGTTTDLLKFTNLDDAIMSKVQGVKKMIDDFLTKTTGVAGLEAQIAQVKEWVGTCLKIFEVGKSIVTDLKNGDYKALFNKIMTGWTEIKNTSDLFKGIGIDDAVMAKIHGIQSDIEGFLNKASGGVLDGSLPQMVEQIKGLKKNVDAAIGFFKALKGDIENKDFSAALKRVLTAWTDFNQLTGGLIPNSKIDDNVIAKSNELKKTMEEFLQNNSKGLLSGDLLDMVAQVEGYYKQLTGFMGEIQGLWNDIKSGNVKGVFERLKKGWDEIESKKGDIIPGTTIDEELYKKAMALKDQGLSFLAGLVKDGSDDEKKTIVNGWIADAGRLISLFVSGEKIPNIDHLRVDKIVVETPPLKKLSTKEEGALMNELDGGNTGSLRQRLLAVLTTVTNQTKTLHGKIDDARDAALARNIKSVVPITQARDYFTKIIKEQKRVANIIGLIGKIVIGVVTAVLLPASASAIVTGVLAVAKDITQLSTTVGSLVKTGNPLSDMAVSMGATLLQGFLAKPNDQPLGDLDAEVKKQFNLMVNEKYQYIKQFVTEINNYLAEIGDRLGQLDESGLATLQTTLMARINQWNGVQKQIEDKYLSTTSSQVNDQKVIDQTLRLFYCDWLATNKDISLINEIIKDLDRLGISKGAGVELSTGAGAKIARGLGQIFGSWLSFGEGKKIKKLAEYGRGQIPVLTKPEAWNGVI